MQCKTKIDVEHGKQEINDRLALGMLSTGIVQLLPLKKEADMMVFLCSMSVAVFSHLTIGDSATALFGSILTALSWYF